MAQTNDLQRIAAELRRMHGGEAWHGPSLREALAGVSAGDAATHPWPGVHSIFELTHHIAAWAGEVTRRLGGSEPAEPEDGDWPAANAHVDDARWTAAQSLVATRHHTLIEAILAFDPARLDDVVGRVRDAALGTGTTYYAMLHGLVQHDAYHSGQIILIKRALGRR